MNEIELGCSVRGVRNKWLGLKRVGDGLGFTEYTVELDGLVVRSKVVISITWNQDTNTSVLPERNTSLFRPIWRENKIKCENLSKR